MSDITSGISSSRAVVYPLDPDVNEAGEDDEEDEEALGVKMMNAMRSNKRSATYKRKHELLKKKGKRASTFADPLPLCKKTGYYNIIFPL